MRPLVLLLSLGISTFVHAAPLVRFSTSHTQVSTATDLSLYVENLGDETIIEPRVKIELNPGLAFAGSIRWVGDWTCTIEDERNASCRQGAIGGGVYTGIVFNVTASRPGRFNVRATLTAQNLPYVEPVIFNVTSNNNITVSTSADFGTGSLRAAIDSINGDPLCGAEVECRIRFGFPMTIAPSIPLPPIRKCNVVLDGGDGIEPGDQPKPIVISGENAAWGNGLEVRAACAEGVRGVTLHSLVVHSWPWNGVYFEAPGPQAAVHTINLSYIGTNAMGLEARPNRGRGVVTDSPHERIAIYRTVVSGNGRSGVALFRGEAAQVSDSKIGINRYHEPLGNGASGIFTYGVPLTVGGGIVAYNTHAGVSITRGTSAAWTQFTQMHSNGGLPIDWALDDRTLPDDESDRILNTPRITEAFYDSSQNLTIVRGVVRVRRGVFGGDHFTIRSYVASSPRGDVIEALPSGYTTVDAPLSGNASEEEFAIALQGDYRGKLIAVQTDVSFSQRTPHLASEISEAEVVR